MDRQLRSTKGRKTKNAFQGLPALLTMQLKCFIKFVKWLLGYYEGRHIIFQGHQLTGLWILWEPMCNGTGVH